MKPTNISPDETWRILVQQNPWWTAGSVPSEFTMWHKNDLHQDERKDIRNLHRALRDDRFRRFRMIVGPRRVGKTTAMYRAVQSLIVSGVEPARLVWIRLDHPKFMHQPLDEIVFPVLERLGASAEKPVYLFLDELAYLRDWDRWLKTAHDDRWPVRIAASSSATAALRKGGESGVGRWIETRLMPYSFDEAMELITGRSIVLPDHVLESADLNDVLTATAGDLKILTAGASWRSMLPVFLIVGGFPELLHQVMKLGEKIRPEDKEKLLYMSQNILRNDAFEKAVFKDIPHAFGVDDPFLLQRLAYTLAGQVAQILSPNNLSSDLQTSALTISKYARYLEESFLMFFLPNWSGSERSIQSRGRKVYLVDGAVGNAILQRGVRPLVDGPEMGHLYENAAASHLFCLANQENSRLFHWRDKNAEVDLILADPRGPIAFEIETGEKRRVKGLDALVARHEKFRGRTWKIGAHLLPSQVSAATPNTHGRMTLETFLIVIGALAARSAAKRLESY